jgi:protoheme IX farnesyltransferase
MLKTYAMLTKPGIILGNIVTTAGGFALAAQGIIDVRLFLNTLVGLSFIVASAGIFNNYIDRAIDAQMERTKRRAFALGQVSIPKALCFAGFLGFAGVLCLMAYTNFLTVFTAIFGFAVYLTQYAFLKYRSFYGTIVGSIAGAIPPLVGYCAVSNQFDLAAFILFMAVVLWQMPHFFAIAIYRLNDYAAAKIPVLPLKKGITTTKLHMLLYILAFIGISLSLVNFASLGNLYAGSMLLLGGGWLCLCLAGFKTPNDEIWAYRMFICSLVVIMGLCSTIILEFSAIFS